MRHPDDATVTTPDGGHQGGDVDASDATDSDGGDPFVVAPFDPALDSDPLQPPVLPPQVATWTRCDSSFNISESGATTTSSEDVSFVL